MGDQQHFIEIYEPYEYDGPNPLEVSGVAVLKGPTRSNYYLLELSSPVEYDHERVEQLLVAPRYNGDKIDRAVCSTCTVNIARVPPDTHLDDSTSLTFESILRWGVGKISPAPH